jgi:hypothetical protein
VKDPLSHTAVVIMIHSRRQPQHRCRVCDFYLLPAPTPSDHSISANTYFYTFSIIGAEYLTKKRTHEQTEWTIVGPLRQFNHQINSQYIPWYHPQTHHAIWSLP